MVFKKENVLKKQEVFEIFPDGSRFKIGIRNIYVNPVNPNQATLIKDGRPLEKKDGKWVYFHK